MRFAMQLCASALVLLALTGANAGEVAATVGGKKISLEEVDAKARANDITPFQQLYDARRVAAGEIIADMLLEAEAAKRGIPKEQLIAQEITGKIEPVTDAQLQAFYDSNKSQMGGRTLDQVRGDLQGFLSQQNAQATAQTFLNSLRKGSDVQMLLDPPRVEVEITSHDPTKGPDDAPVRIVEFSEFQCPYCARVGPTMQRIMDTYGDKIQVVFRNYPLPFHDDAVGAAEGAQCADAQGKFWEYHDKLFANQRALDTTNLKKYAVELGLDAEAFNACLDSGKYKETVTEDHAYGSTLGVRGTPAFFINGRFLNGAQPFEAFQSIIDEELERKTKG